MDENYDIFISYNHSIKQEIEKLEQILMQTNFKVCRDNTSFSKNDEPLTSQIQNAIKNSKMFLCCLTENYCKSYYCNLEFQWANELTKPIIVLMIDIRKPVDAAEIYVNGRKWKTGISIFIR